MNNLEGQSYSCLQCSDCTVKSKPTENHHITSEQIDLAEKPTPNFTADASPEDVARLNKNTQQGEERVILDPITQFTQATEQGFTPLEQLTDIFGSQTTRYANGTEFTWFQEEIQPR